ncbi:MAG TPA: PaaI family thioesterase [Kofleriaceae bacterium]|jgi:acyl-coenzyme A thioesterase PaaI-like protein|nr:PaaI family thioesterase [Kofleriaceae bacterium]
MTADWIRALETDPTFELLGKPPNRERNWVHADPDRRLDLRYYVDKAGQRLVGVVTFGSHTEGHPGHGHGGAIASVIDDAMGTTAWTAGLVVVTLSMTVNMRKVVPLNVALRLEGWVDRVDGRKVHVACRLVTPPDTVHADATGLFLQPAGGTSSDQIRRDG